MSKSKVNKTPYEGVKVENLVLGASVFVARKLLHIPKVYRTVWGDALQRSLMSMSDCIVDANSKPTSRIRERISLMEDCLKFKRRADRYVRVLAGLKAFEPEPCLPKGHENYEKEKAKCERKGLEVIVTISTMLADIEEQMGAWLGYTRKEARMREKESVQPEASDSVDFPDNGNVLQESGVSL